MFISEHYKENWKSRIKMKEIALCADLYDSIAELTFNFFHKKGFIWLPVSPTTKAVSSPSALGSDSKPVQVKINENSLFLIDSAQFQLEYGCRLCNKGCFYFMHSFRFEEPDYRHLSQFIHSEAEFMGELKDVIKLVEQYIRFLTRNLKKKHFDKLKKIDGVLERVEKLEKKKNSFTVIAFDDVEKILKKINGCIEIVGKNARTLTPFGEKQLLKKIGEEFIWVTHWDKLSVPFYQAINNEEKAINGDLLFGIGEVVGAGQRHNSGAKLKIAMEDHELDCYDYQWYIEMKEMVPLQTSGFGMGVERYLAWLLGDYDIRNFVIFTRNRNQEGEP